MSYIQYKIFFLFFQKFTCISYGEGVMKVSVNKIFRESENPLGGGEVQLDVLLERLLEHQLDVWDL